MSSLKPSRGRAVGAAPVRGHGWAVGAAPGGGDGAGVRAVEGAVRGDGRAGQSHSYHPHPQLIPSRERPVGGLFPERGNTWKLGFVL